MRTRALGANAVLAAALEAIYGVPPANGYFKLPFVSYNLGEEVSLLDSDLLGQGREMLDPTYDVANNEGDVVVPVDVRAFGLWLKATFGEPTTAASVKATGKIGFTAQPAANSTITVNGTPFTFVAGAPAGNQIQKGADLAATIANAVAALNASVVAGVAAATYTAAADGITITHDTMGLAGNDFTLAASATANAELSGPTLEGGAVTHTFVSGEADLPSLALEAGFPEVPSYGMNFGAVVGGLKIGLSRSGLLNATVSLVAQGENDPTDDSEAGDLDEFQVERFAQAIGEVKRNGVVLGSTVSAEFGWTNDLDKVETIRRDGRIDGVDPGVGAATGQLVVRFADRVLLDQATSREPCELTFGWEISPGKKLLFTVHRVFLPKPRKPISGPKGVQVTFAWKAAKDPVLGRALTVALTNDVADY